MPRERPPLRYGRIVFAWIADQRGFSSPALVLTPDDLIDDSASIVVAAITTTFPEPPPKIICHYLGIREAQVRLV
jgi:hypothetical protein